MFLQYATLTFCPSSSSSDPDSEYWLLNSLNSESRSVPNVNEIALDIWDFRRFSNISVDGRGGRVAAGYLGVGKRKVFGFLLSSVFRRDFRPKSLNFGDELRKLCFDDKLIFGQVFRRCNFKSNLLNCFDFSQEFIWIICKLSRKKNGKIFQSIKIFAKFQIFTLFE